MTLPLLIALAALAVALGAYLYRRRRPGRMTPAERATNGVALALALAALALMTAQAAAITPTTPSSAGRASVVADTPTVSSPCAVTGQATLTLPPRATGALTVGLYAARDGSSAGRLQGSRRERFGPGGQGTISVTAFARPGRALATWYVVAEANIRLRSGRVVPLRDVSNVGSLLNCRPLR